MEIFSKEKQLKNLDDWKEFAPPKDPKTQWVPNYSAYEFAKLVLSTCFEKEIIKDICGDEISLSSIKKAYPELKTKFDNLRGEGRNHDLACICTGQKENVAVCFEAKVRESLDNTNKEHIKKAIEKAAKENRNTKVPERINMLCKKIFGDSYVEEKYGFIHYQLLSATAGTVRFAFENKCNKAVIVIYQIETPITDNNSTVIKQNRKEVTDFLNLFGYGLSDLEEKKLYKLGNIFSGKTENDIGNKIETFLVYIKRRKID